jgi:hypothetical protein
MKDMNSKRIIFSLFIGCHSEAWKHLLANLIILHFIAEKLRLARLRKKKKLSNPKYKQLDFNRHSPKAGKTPH